MMIVCLVTQESIAATKTFGTVKHFKAEATRTASTTAFNKELEEAPLVVVDFYADWCGPCKALGPCLDALAQKFKQVLILKVNIDTYEDIANTHGIKSIPTILFFTNGNIKPKERLVGKKSKEDISKVIEKLL